ncbi:hypothetical protein PAPYR_6259 [Paratrimastix pyriformis]|uniref:F-box domain-containing protein n=1 Tax=Paratrimastix pyriformis TaxID=342808 RepID=A0ABQ8UH74_9EUKA|nr:hypothetical protein PAPYR_6259 [Paratrimastix pyriformis]
MLRNKTRQPPVAVAPRPPWDQWGTAILSEEETIGWAAVAARLGGGALVPKADQQPQSLFSRVVRTRAVSANEDDHDDDARSLLLRLPPELLVPIVEASPVQLHTYLSLLSLSHSTRTTIRGAPHELSFEEPDSDLAECSEGASPVLTADALAAIVGPCKGLVKLTLPASPLPNASPPLVGCGLNDAACLPWVNEAFAGHSRLAVLHVPWAEPLRLAIQHILPLLPGLEELHFLKAQNGTSFLEALVQSCPRLRALHFSSRRRMFNDPVLDLNALKPLGRTLRELDIETPGFGTIECLAPCFPCLERLTARPCKDRYIVPRSLPLDGPNEAIGFCGLQSLSLLHKGRAACPSAVAAQMLVSCQATLQSVELGVDDLVEESFFPVLAALIRLPRLTSLRLCASGVPHAIVLEAIWSLVDRLDRLSLEGWCIAFPVSITSSRLRDLSISMNAPLTLDCPALEVLTLPAFGSRQPLVLVCPRLRSIEGGISAVDMGIATAMPDLARLCIHKKLDDDDDDSSSSSFSDDGDGDGGDGDGDGDDDDDEEEEEMFETACLSDLLAIASPSRLRHLSGVCVTEPATLHRLWALGSLTRLEAHLAASALADLHLPAHIQFLRVAVNMPFDEPFHQLSLEAPGLRTLALSSILWAHPVLLALRCPALVSLNLKIHTLIMLDLGADSSPPLRSLTISDCTDVLNASLLNVLLRHGHHLQHIALAHRDDRDPWLSWAALKVALERLPRLVSLELKPPPRREMTLLFPRLRRLAIDDDDGSLTSLVLDCPLLEELRMSYYKVQLMLKQPANLRLVEGPMCIVDVLRTHFPLAIVVFTDKAPS